MNLWLGDLYSAAVNMLEGDHDHGDTHPDPDEVMEELTLENIRMQVDNVAGLDIVKNAWKQGRDLRIVGWLYHLETGRLEDLGICAGPMGTVGCEA